MATPLIQFDGLTHAYGSLLALDGLTGAYRRVGFASEDDAVYGFLSARDLVRYAAQLSRGDASRDAVDAALARVNLLDDAHRPIGEYCASRPRWPGRW